MKAFVTILFTFISLLVSAQQVLTLDACYDLAERNYPLARQTNLLEEKSNAEVNIIKKGKLPQLNLNAQATYQSEVIQMPIELPNSTIEAPNKDQYRATLDANQLIYHGGSIGANIKLKEAELKLLKAQIHPHFLFNTLNNLYGLTLEKSDDAPDLVLKLSEILDYILYRCDEKSVPLSEEINNLKNYIEIEKIRYSENLKLDLNFPQETNNLQIAPLIVLPFVENAFKHGVSKFPGIAFVKIKMVVEDKTLVFDIENTRNKDVTKNDNYSKGIGLVNVRKRLDLMYPEKYKLNIKELEEIFSVNLAIKLED